jgi:hypothetical protein
VKIRPATKEDQGILDEIHAQSGMDFKFAQIAMPLAECAFVVEDDSGQPLGVSVARRTPEIFLALRKEPHALVKVRALQLIHEQMSARLTELGYEEAFCFLPPHLERSYGRHLMQIFGWRKTWAAYVIHSPVTGE